MINSKLCIFLWFSFFSIICKFNCTEQIFKKQLISHDLPANYNWHCTTCGDLTSVIFARIRIAILYWQRNDFTALSTVWADEILKPHATVAVNVFSYSKIEEIIIPNTIVEKSVTSIPKVYDIIYMELGTSDVFNSNSIDVFFDE